MLENPIYLSKLYQNQFMTLTINQEHVYLASVLILMAIQVYQQIRIEKLKKDVDSIWTQIGNFALALATKIQELEKELDKKKNSE